MLCTKTCAVAGAIKALHESLIDSQPEDEPIRTRQSSTYNSQVAFVPPDSDFANRPRNWSGTRG